MARWTDGRSANRPERSTGDRVVGGGSDFATLRNRRQAHHRATALGDIDRHFHVDVKETKAEEGMEVVRKLLRRRAVVEVRDCPRSCQDGDRSGEAQLKPARYSAGSYHVRQIGVFRLSVGSQFSSAYEIARSNCRGCRR